MENVCILHAYKICMYIHIYIHVLTHHLFASRTSFSTPSPLKYLHPSTH